MKHLEQITLPLFGYGVLGILIMAFAKMIEINSSSKDHSFKGVFKKFITKDWPAYGMSILIMIGLVLTHDEWMSLKDSENDAVDGKIKALAGMPKLFMIFSGMILHWAIYKYWLGKYKTRVSSRDCDDNHQNYYD